MIINNSNFILTEIPNYHPVVDMWDRIQWWKEHKSYCINGYWSSGKWMPGPLYYYINFHTIPIEGKGIRGRKLGRPWLRDIEWESFYIYEEARGFSGFELDEEYTCNRWYGPEKDMALDFGYITEKEVSNGKKYIPAREYLRKIHKTSLGNPLYENEAKNIIDLEARGGGKQLPHSEIVMTPNGPTTMGQICVGDLVLGSDGKPTKVTDVFYQGIDDVYELELQDGRTVRCGYDHQWEVYEGGKRKVLQTGELIDKGLWYIHSKNGGKSFKFKIKNTDPVEYSEKDLIIPPYVLGVLLGDGTMTTTTPKIASSDKFILDTVSEKLDNKYKIVHDKYTNNNYTLKYIGKDKCSIREDKIQTNPLHNAIVELGVNKNCKNKFIPEIYKYGSIEQRLELIRGMLDTDGSITKEGSIEFTNTNEKLLDDFIEVARSLGIQCRKGIDDRSDKPHDIKGHKCFRSITYRAYLKTELSIFKLPRKLERLQPLKRENWVSIINIKKLDYQEPSSCIMVDNDRHTFLTRDYIVTHNTARLSGLIGANFLFDGAVNYEQYLAEKNRGESLQSGTVVGAPEDKWSVKLLSYFKTALENLPGSYDMGSDGKAKSPLLVDTSGSLRPASDFFSSTGSVIHHRSFGDNPLSANSTRPNLACIDEIGFLRSLSETWGGLESTQQSSQFRNLVIYATGTGGYTRSGTALYSQGLFYNPRDWNCLEFDDIWEGKGKIGYFVPATYTLNRFKEGKNLITNEAKANKFINHNREKAKAAKDATKYLIECINAPIKPSEIFLTAEGNFFPTNDLKARLADVETSEIIQKTIIKAEFYEKDGKIDFKHSDKPVITEFPILKETVLDAPCMLFELPKRDTLGNIPYGRYIAGNDSVDNDGGQDTYHSLQSTFILDTFTDRIVAEYTARTRLIKNYYDEAIRLIRYYNAKVAPESNKKGFIQHCIATKKTFILAETPEILREVENSSVQKIGNQKYGIPINPSGKVKSWGLELILAWLESEAYNEEGVRNLDKIKSIGLLKELIHYSKDINVDRVSALIVLMIYREDQLKLHSDPTTSSTKTRADDEFFNKPFTSKIFNSSIFN